MGTVPEQEGHRISFDGELTARDAVSLHEIMLAAMQQDQEIVVDTRTLVSLDTSIVQILLASRKSAERLGRKLTILTGRDGVLPATLDRLGVSSAALH